MKGDLTKALDELSRRELITFIMGSVDPKGLEDLLKLDLSDQFKKAFFIYGCIKLTKE